MNSTIKFSEDGRRFSINFEKSPDIVIISSKFEGIKLISNLTEKKELTLKEFTDMFRDILTANNLPITTTGEIIVTVGIIEMNLVEILIIDAMQRVDDIMAIPVNPVDIAFLKVYELGQKKCCRIYTTKDYSARLYSKNEALTALDKLKEMGDVNDEEFLKVKMEIEESSLPNE